MPQLLRFGSTRSREPRDATICRNQVLWRVNPNRLDDPISPGTSKLGKYSPRRILRGLLWRTARLTSMIVLRAPRCDARLTPPEGFTAVRVTAASPVADRDMVERAMREAEEPDGLVAPRFARGDELFGWALGKRIVSFGWVARREREVGPARLADARGRAFLYNFFSLRDFRGRGLYPSLLLEIRFVLGGEQVTEYIIDVDVRNWASRSGIAKAGFTPVASVLYLTILTRWRFTLCRSVMEKTDSPIFPAR